MSLDSMLRQIDEQFEVIVVDSLSRDGSRSILRKRAAVGQIRLIERKCSRGAGRQIAFENSVGEFVIAHVDMDNFYLPRLMDLVQLYHSHFEGLLLRVDNRKDEGAGSLTLSTRSLLEQLGGWNDLQVGEDWDLWRRAAERSLYRWTAYELAVRLSAKVEARRLRHLMNGLRGMRDRYRTSRPMTVRHLPDSAAKLMGYLLSIGMPRYASAMDEPFLAGSDAYFVPTALAYSKIKGIPDEQKREIA